MYISTFLPLQTALSGVEAAQEELSTTSNNIANANTAGYEEESVVLTGAPALTIADGDAAGDVAQLGTGVDATGVQNADDPYLDASARLQNAATNAATTQQTYLQQIQSTLDEPNAGGISSQLSTLWSDWNAVADNPTSASAKEALVDDGQSLAGSFNTLSSELSQISSDATAQYGSLTGAGGQVEKDATEIAQLNQQIAASGGTGDNQLIDERSAALDDLSTLASVSVTNNSDGTVTVGFGDAATPLVSGSTVTWPQTLTAASGGTLGALLGLTGSSGTIAQLSASLDGVASHLANEVNNPSVNGTPVAVDPPFFSGSTAGTLTVTATAATVQTGASGDSGDNSVAAAEAANAGGVADSSYGAFVTQVGEQVATANTDVTTQQAVSTQIDNQRSSLEGVNVSTEMTNLIEQQQAYEASAKVMNTFSSMMDSLMSAVGV